MQNVAIMLIDNYSYLRLVFYIRNVNICFYSVVVHYTRKHYRTLYTPYHFVFYSVWYYYVSNTMLYKVIII